MAKPKPQVNSIDTIALPVLPDGEFYLRCKRVIDVPKGKWYDSFTIEMERIHAKCLFGMLAFVRQAVVDACAPKEVDSKEKGNAACKAKLAKIYAGTFTFGAGGGAALDTYEIVLREIVSAELMEYVGEKKGEADKLARQDALNAYRNVVNVRAKAEGVDPIDAFGPMWAVVQDQAENEAVRRDAGVSPVTGSIADMIATAMIKEKATEQKEA